MAWLDEIGDKLAAAGHGTEGTDIFLYGAPDSVRTCLYVVPTPSEPMTGQFSSTTPLYEMPRFTVISRVAKGEAAAAGTLITAVAATLHSVQTETLGSTVWHWIEVSSPFSLGLSTQSEPRMAVTCRASKDY